MKYLVFVLLFSSLVACAQESKKVAQAPVAVPEKPKVEPMVKIPTSTINWLTINQALELQKKTPKKIFIDFYTHWCGPCKLLDKKTFQNPDVVKFINKNFYAVKFNAEGNENVTFDGKSFVNTNYRETKGRGVSHPFTRYLKVNAYPTMIFLDEKAQYITPVRGVVSPKDLEPYLKVIASDEYINIKTPEQWKAWLNTFTPQFN